MINPIKKLTFLKRERAQTMVEFALVFPIVLLITYGLIEVGRLMLINAEVYSSAREGARYGATALNYKNCTGIRDATTRLLFLVLANDITINIKYDHGPSDVPVNLCTPPGSPPGNTTYVGPTDLTLGDRIVVYVNVFYRPIVGKFLGFQGFNINTTNFRTLLKNVPIAYP
jgi:hypothetical protein